MLVHLILEKGNIHGASFLIYWVKLKAGERREEQGDRRQEIGDRKCSGWFFGLLTLSASHKLRLVPSAPFDKLRVRSLRQAQGPLPSTSSGAAPFDRLRGRGRKFGMQMTAAIGQNNGLTRVRFLGGAGLWKIH
jgi:hypothetical protein